MAMKRFRAVSRFVHARVSTRENAKKTRRKIAGAGKVAKRGVFWGSGGAEPVYNRGFPSARFSFFRNPAPGRFFARIRVRICTFFFFFSFSNSNNRVQRSLHCFLAGSGQIGGYFLAPPRTSTHGKVRFFAILLIFPFFAVSRVQKCVFVEKKARKNAFFSVCYV